MKLDRDRTLGVLLTFALLAAAAYLLFQPGFLTYYFAGPGKTPWWERAVWGNVWACVPCGVLAVLYARAKLAAHRKAQHDEHVEAMAEAKHHTMLAEEMHHKLSTGKDHPRVVARMAAGEHPTPPRPDQ
jgi:hypothetical protein